MFENEKLNSYSSLGDDKNEKKINTSYVLAWWFLSSQVSSTNDYDTHSFLSDFSLGFNVDNINTISADIERIKRQADKQREKGLDKIKDFKWETKDIILRNIEKEYVETIEKYQSIKDTIKEDSKVTILELRFEVDQLQTEADEVADYAEENTFKGIPELYDLYNIYEEITETPERFDTEELEGFIDKMNHQISIFHFNQEDWLYKDSILAINNLLSDLLMDWVEDNELWLFKNARNAVSTILKERKIKELENKGDNYFTAKSEEYGVTVREIKEFEEELHSQTKLGVISYPELNAYIKYLKENNQLTKEKINSVFTPQLLVDISNSWLDKDSNSLLEINKMADFQLWLAKVFILSWDYKDAAFSKFVNSDLLKKVFNSEYANDNDVQKIKKRLSQDAIEYFDNQPEWLNADELTRVYQDVLNFAGIEKLEDPEKIINFINFKKFNENIEWAEDIKYEIASTVCYYINEQLNIEGGDTINKVVEGFNNAVAEVNEDYAKYGIELSKIDHKVALSYSIRIMQNKNQDVLDSLSSRDASIGRFMISDELNKKRVEAESESKALKVLENQAKQLTNEDVERMVKDPEKWAEELMITYYLVNIHENNGVDFFTNNKLDSEETNNINNKEEEKKKEENKNGIKSDWEKVVEQEKIDMHNEYETLTWNYTFPFEYKNENSWSIEISSKIKANVDKDPKTWKVELTMNWVKETFDDSNDVFDYLVVVKNFIELGFENTIPVIMGPLRKEANKFYKSDVGNWIQWNEYTLMLRYAANLIGVKELTSQPQYADYKEIEKENDPKTLFLKLRRLINKVWDEWAWNSMSWIVGELLKKNDVTNEDGQVTTATFYQWYNNQGWMKQTRKEKVIS